MLRPHEMVNGCVGFESVGCYCQSSDCMHGAVTLVKRHCNGRDGYGRV